MNLKKHYLPLFFLGFLLSLNGFAQVGVIDDCSTDTDPNNENTYYVPEVDGSDVLTNDFIDNTSIKRAVGFGVMALGDASDISPLIDENGNVTTLPEYLAEDSDHTEERYNDLIRNYEYDFTYPVGIGYYAGYNSRDFCIAIGSEALRHYDQGRSMAIGYRALTEDFQDPTNIAIGAFAMENFGQGTIKYTEWEDFDCDNRIDSEDEWNDSNDNDNYSGNECMSGSCSVFSDSDCDGIWLDVDGDDNVDGSGVVDPQTASAAQAAFGSEWTDSDLNDINLNETIEDANGNGNGDFNNRMDMDELSGKKDAQGGHNNIAIGFETLKDSNAGEDNVVLGSKSLSLIYYHEKFSELLNTFENGKEVDGEIVHLYEQFTPAGGPHSLDLWKKPQQGVYLGANIFSNTIMTGYGGEHDGNVCIGAKIEHDNLIDEEGASVPINIGFKGTTMLGYGSRASEAYACVIGFQASGGNVCLGANMLLKGTGNMGIGNDVEMEANNTFQLGNEEMQNIETMVPVASKIETTLPQNQSVNGMGLDYINNLTTLTGSEQSYLRTKENDVVGKVELSSLNSVEGNVEIQYGLMSLPLIKAIQEQQDQINVDAQKINEIEAQNEKLAKEIETLQALLAD